MKKMGTSRALHFYIDELSEATKMLKNRKAVGLEIYVLRKLKNLVLRPKNGY